MMMYFYTVKHNKTGMTLIGISKYDPRSTPKLLRCLASENKHWRKHLKKHKWVDRKGNSLLTIKVLHTADDLTVLLKWKQYYYKCWNVLTNPLFIHSLNSKNRASGKDHHNFNKKYITGVERHYYNNGYTNVFVPTGTQPHGYRPGKIVPKGIPTRKRSEQAKLKTKLNGAGHKCMSPDGIKYPSLTDAAKAEGVTYSAIISRIKHGKSGWKYI